MSLLTLLLFVLASGSGCAATRHAVNLSQPHWHELPNPQVRQIDDAFETSDGRLLLRVGGRRPGESKSTTLTIALPPVPGPGRTATERVVVPPTAVSAGWRPESQTASQLSSVPIGPPLVFDDSTSYDWNRLRPSADHAKELRLVRRPGAVKRWEVLYLNRDTATGECHFTVFEVRPEQVIVRRPSALILLPLAIGADVMVGGMTAAGWTGVALGSAMH